MSDMYRYTLTIQKSKGWAAIAINIRKKLYRLGFILGDLDDSQLQLWMYVSHRNKTAMTHFLLENKYDILVEEE